MLIHNIYMCSLLASSTADTGFWGEVWGKSMVCCLQKRKRRVTAAPPGLCPLEFSHVLGGAVTLASPWGQGL